MSVNYLEMMLEDGATTIWQCDDVDVNLIDATQNGHTATFAALDGVTENVRWFIGSDYVGFALDATEGAATFDPISIAGPCSVEMWIQPTNQAPERNLGAGAFGTLIAHATGETGLYLYQFPSEIGTIYSVFVALGNVVILTPPLPTIGQNYLVLTVDGDGLATVYLNGNSVGTYASYNTEPTPLVSRLCADSSTFAGPLGATILSEIAIYSGTVLTPTQIANHYDWVHSGGNSGQASGGSGITDGSYQLRYRAGCAT